MSSSYTSSPPRASMACSGTALLTLCLTVCWECCYTEREITTNV